SELTIRDSEINGYVKPLFKGMHVYDPQQDGDKPFFRKVREGLVGTVAWVLKNRARDEVGTRVTVSGKVDSPQFSTWEAVLGLLKNAFIKAILPGFEKEVDRSNR
ncbi:MAG: hypothetical protein ACREQA_11505, partial [Candidatus Binatia bacterium]